MPSKSNSNKKSTKNPRSKIGSIFKPFSVHGIKFKNRILAPPTIDNHSNVNNKVTPAIIKHYHTLTRQGAGTIIMESTYMIKQGKSHINQLNISEENHLNGFVKLVNKIKKKKTSIGIRLTHTNAHTSENAYNEQPITPSVLNFGRDYNISREFEKGDIKEIILSFVHTTERTTEVGMDFIEINKREQHLLDQCYCVKLNSRDDEYSVERIENRFRLALEIITTIKKRKSVNIPISYYFSIFDKIEDGFKPKDLNNMLKLLEKAGMKIFHPLATHAMNKCFENKDPLYEWTAKYTNKPLIINGNIKSPQLLEKATTLNSAN